MKEIILELTKWKRNQIRSKTQKKQLRAQPEGFADIAEQNEGVVYGAGLYIFLLYYTFYIYNLQKTTYFPTYAYNQSVLSGYIQVKKILIILNLRTFKTVEHSEQG